MSTRAVDPARSRIVLVGTPAYDDPTLPDVPAVANNVADLAGVLTHPDLGGFSAAHCMVAPPRSGIAQIGDLLMDAAAEAEDLLLFYYSGHGMLGPLRRELYLGLAGTRHDRLAFTALPFDAVRDACLASRARSRVVILDSCFSGRAIGETLAGTEESVLGQIQVSGTYTLTSAPANRTALILPGERHTAFTGRMLSLMRTGSSAAGPLLSLGDVYRHLYAQLLAEGLPVPQQRGTETADQLGLVRNAVTKGEPFIRPEPYVPADAERNEFTVVIQDAGKRKIQVITVIREFTMLGPKEAKDLVDTAPQPMLHKVDRETANRARAALEEAGARVRIAHASQAFVSSTPAVQAEFDVVIQRAGNDKIQVIKAVRQFTALGLRESKDLVDNAPKPILRRVGKETADKAKAALERAGATVTIN
jgi:ribosomal protein L7/L12